MGKIYKVYVSARAEVEVDLGPFPGASRSGLESARPAQLFLQQFANRALSKASAGWVTFSFACLRPGSRRPASGPPRGHSHESPGARNDAGKGRSSG